MEEYLYDLPLDIYADDIAEAVPLGDCFRTVFFSWTRPPGSKVMIRRPVACIVRPRRAIDQGKLVRMLGAAESNGLRAGMN